MIDRFALHDKDERSPASAQWQFSNFRVYPGVAGLQVTAGRVTSGLTPPICDKLGFGLKLEVTNGPHWLRPRQHN